MTVASRAGTVVGFELEERPPAAGPWKFRLAVVYDDGVDGDPLPSNATRIDPQTVTLKYCTACAGPCAEGRPACQAWQCGNHADQRCLITARATGHSEKHLADLCTFHTTYGDRRFTVTRVLHDIPATAELEATAEGRSQ